MGKDRSNWLETLWELLSSPIKALGKPWWENLVEKKAESEAVRSKLLEAIICFRVTDFKRQARWKDPDRALGMSQRVFNQLHSTLLKDKAIDLAYPTTLATIEQEIELHAVELQTWVQLACLMECEIFDPNHTIMVNFTDEQGNQSHAFTLICSLQNAYPFTHIFAIESPTTAKVSGLGINFLREYFKRTVFPETVFQVSMSMPEPIEMNLTESGARRLPRGWRPKG